MKLASASRRSRDQGTREAAAIQQYVGISDVLELVQSQRLSLKSECVRTAGCERSRRAGCYGSAGNGAMGGTSPGSRTPVRLLPSLLSSLFSLVCFIQWWACEYGAPWGTDACAEASGRADLRLAMVQDARLISRRASRRASGLQHVVHLDMNFRFASLSGRCTLLSCDRAYKISPEPSSLILSFHDVSLPSNCLQPSFTCVAPAAFVPCRVVRPFFALCGALCRTSSLVLASTARHPHHALNLYFICLLSSSKKPRCRPSDVDVIAPSSRVVPWDISCLVSPSRSAALSSLALF